MRRALMVADVVALTGTMAFMEAVYAFRGGPTGDVGWVAEFLLFLALLPIWLLMATLLGLYQHDETRANHTTVDDLVGVFHLVTTGVWVLLAASWALPGVHTISLPRLVTFWALAIPSVTLARTIARGLSRRSDTYLQRTLIVGAGDVGRLAAHKMLSHPEYGLDLVGFVDDDPHALDGERGEPEIVGTTDQLASVVADHRVERVVVAFPGAESAELLRVIRQVRRLNVLVDVVPRLFEVIGPRAEIHSLETVPLLGLVPDRPRRSSRVLKRGADLIVASALLIATAPVFAFIAWRVRRDSPGPVFFRQQRLGLNGRPFTMLKFRSMLSDTDPDVHRRYVASLTAAAPASHGPRLYKLEQGDRITRSGRWLRRTSLDELPQLLNVVHGEMSFVGPRPCLPHETELFDDHHFDRFLVPPGLTGLWQVKARAHSTFKEALEMDVAYVSDWSLMLDLQLVLRTPREVLRQRNSTA